MEDVALCASNGIMKTGDGCSIVLELAENDPLFGKKKHILHDKGFGVKEDIHIKGTLCPDLLSETLDKLLQIGRIICLDEVELYFGDFDTQLGVYSHRNEVEALNLILSLLDSSLSGQVYKQIDGWKNLRKAIIHNLHEHVHQNKLCSKVDKSYICDKEKCLVQWGMSNGVRTKLEIAYVEEAGRGAIAMEDLEVGDIALEIPVTIIISEELVHDSEMYNILGNNAEISSETMLLLWSMKEKHNPDSKFKNYFETLPKEFNTGLSFGIDAIVALEGTLLLEEIMIAKEILRSQYDELTQVLHNHPDIFPPEFYTWEQFLWACELWYSNSMKVMFADGKLRTCLVPIAGFLNHSLCPNIVHYGKVDSATNSLKFPLSRPCHAGEQCCLGYGNFSTSHLITFYGFSPQGDNPYDVIPLDVDISEFGSIDDCPMSNWSTHMVRGTWHSKNHDIFFYGLPSPLLDYLRRVRNPLQYKPTQDQASLENELEVLKDLESTFIGMMENLGDMDVMDRENTSWDVKLAMEYRDLQRRIVSSILTSCSAGSRLVENELAKVMS